MYNYVVHGERTTIISEKRIRRPHGVPPNFCPFCPGNEHLDPPSVLEVRDKEGWKIRVVPNKYPCVSPHNEHAYGYHEVVIESPEHGKTFWLHTVAHISEIIKVWGERERELYRDPKIEYVAVFKNWGAKAGASIPHGHSQIIALDFVPEKVKEKKPLSGYTAIEGDFWKVSVPKTPMFAYEVHIIPKVSVHHIYDLGHDERHELAFFLRSVVEKVTRIVDAYNFFVYTSLKNGENPLHIEIYPRKNIHAGFELGTGSYIVPVSPEKALEYYKSI